MAAGYPNSPSQPGLVQGLSNRTLVQLTWWSFPPLPQWYGRSQWRTDLEGSLSQGLVMSVMLQSCWAFMELTLILSKKNLAIYHIQYILSFLNHQTWCTVYLHCPGVKFLHTNRCYIIVLWRPLNFVSVESYLQASEQKRRVGVTVR